jgi:SAM-dependent methyltransferase/ABC-type cobalamin/Fe3+-siderophores transport system ATPase subunit
MAPIRLTNGKINFSDYGLKHIERCVLYRKNLVIGRNGAGKSRFLGALKEYFKQDETKPLLLDFNCADMSVPSPVLLGVENKKRLVERNLQDINKGFLTATFMSREPEKLVQEMNSNTYRYLFTFLKQNFQGEVLKEILDTCNKTIRDQDLLNKEIHLNPEGEFVISRASPDTAPSGYGERSLDGLSPGEHMIICLFLLIAYLEKNWLYSDEKIVVLLDEPELHLHPRALIKIMEKLSGNAHIRHLIVASHSVFLIPYFEFEEHIYFEDGEVQQQDSLLYRKIYGDLIGLGEEDDTAEVRQRRDSLFDFLGSIGEWEYASYLSECLRPPGTVPGATAEDLQAHILYEFINKQIENGKQIDILDYGCTTGRIGRCLAAMGLPDFFTNKISYSTYDIKEVNAELVNKTTIPFYGKSYLPKDLEAGGLKFDIVLLFNVLHEIDIVQWEKVINTILDITNKEGFILFSENRFLSKGEAPNDTGYLVLNEDGIKKVFGLKNSKSFYLNENKKIIGFIIPRKECEDKTNREYIREALKDLRERTKNDIESYMGLDNKKTYAHYDRKYAFLCQQHLNAERALRKEPPRKEFPMYIANDILTLRSIRESNLPDDIKLSLIKEMTKRDDTEGKQARAYLENFYKKYPDEK